jgi:AcrR family transcriptional regulator
MRRPSKKGPPTAERLLEAASPLFYRRGLGAVTMDDIAAAAGVTKRTLYYHFRTKDDLILAYLKRWRARSKQAFEVQPGDRGPVETLLSAFGQLEKEVARNGFRGCPFVNAVAEINDRRHPATALAASYKEDRRAWFEKLLGEAGIRSAAKLSNEIMVLWDGAMVRALVTGSATVVREARDAATALLEGARLGSSWIWLDHTESPQ